MVANEKNALNQEIRQVAFMPWAGIKAEISFGKYRVWPFSQFKETYIPNEFVRNQIEKILERYFERECREEACLDVPAKTVVIVSPKDEEIGIRQFSEEEQRDLLSISHSFAFASIIDHFSAKASENFTLYFQSFKFGDNHIRVFDTIYENLEMVKFMRPYSADRSFIPFTASNNLLDALGQALSHRDDPEVERLFRSLEFFFWAYMRSEHTFYYLRALSLAAAFEILLGGYQGKFEFMDKIGGRLNRLLAPEGVMWEIRNVEKDGTKNDMKRSVVEWWAYDFYNLRNSIIHGGKVDSKDFIHSSERGHFEIGIILFKRCVKQTLIEKGFLARRAIIDDLVDIITPNEWFKRWETNVKISD